MEENRSLDIESQFETYLRRVGAVKEAMHPIQLQEMRRAFYGSWGQALEVMRDTIGNIEDEEEAIREMQGMYGQVSEFWYNEAKKSEWDKR